MPFDLSSAKPAGFDLSSATPVASDTPKPATGIVNRIGKDVEPWITLATGGLSMIPAGLAGLVTGNADNVRKVEDALTWKPVTQGGQEGLNALNSGIQSIGNTLTTKVNAPGVGDVNPISRYIQSSNDLADSGHPLLATLHNLVPNALATLASDGAVGAAGNVTRDLTRVVDRAPDFASAITRAPTATLNAADAAAAAFRQRLGITDPIPVRPTSAQVSPIPDTLRPPVFESMPVAPPIDRSRAALFQNAPQAQAETAPVTGVLDRTRPALFQNPGEIPAPAPVVAPPVAVPTVQFDLATRGNLSPDEMRARADTLRAIGLDPDQHPSAVTGDQRRAAQEFQDSKVEGLVGNAQNAIIENEQAALRDNGDRLIAATGGTPNISPDTRGRIMRAPLTGLRDYFESQIDSAYKDARATAGTMPAVSPNEFHAKLTDPDFRSELLSSPEGTSLLTQIDAQAKRFGLLNEDGIAPATVDQAEQMRKWLNKVGKPATYGPVGDLKRSIDLDVAKVGGEKTFQFARDLYGLKKDTLDNPKGIFSLLHEDGPNGINQTIPNEKIASRLIEMPNAQFAHVIDTLKNVPAELQPLAQKALAETKAQMLETMHGAGTLNGTAVSYRANPFTKAANNLQDKLPLLFSKSDLAEIKTHNDAAQILHRDKSYPGAEVQKQNFATRGITAALPAVGASAGGLAGAIFGPAAAGAGASVGAGAGKMAAKGLQGRIAAAKAEAIRKGTPLSELLKQQP